MKRPRSALIVPWRTTPVPWRSAATVVLTPVGGTPAGPKTSVRLRASPAGFDLRFSCRANRINAHMVNNGDPLYLEDVVEVFLHPQTTHPGIYLEYEVSPLGRDLTLLCCRSGDGVSRWRPWGIAAQERPRSQVTVRGGEQRPDAAIRSFQADCHIPWSALAGIAPPPRPGDRWRANLYRIDHGGTTSHLAWCDPGRLDFHRLDTFGTLLFEESP